MTNNYIDSDSALRDVIEALASHSWLALDTEFMRERTYYPQLCLIQIGTGDDLFCIDALAFGSVTPLLELICNRDKTMVLHAARQDLEIFFALQQQVSAPLFDTQVAGGLLGFDAQLGYAGLIKQLLGIDLEKGLQRANWAARPLPKNQIDYAIDDVRHLSEAYPVLLEHLEAKQRLEWALEDSARLLQAELYIPQPDKAFERIGQAKVLPAVEQQILKRVAAWREQYAQRVDKPRTWITSDATLIYIAHVKPNSVGALHNIKGIAQEILKTETDNLLTAVAEGMAAEPIQLLEKPLALSDKEQKRYRALKKQVDARASELGIDSPVLGARKDIELLLRGNRNTLLLQGWRKAVIGEELLSLVQG